MIIYNQSQWDEFSQIMCNIFNVEYVATPYENPNISPFNIGPIEPWNKGKVMDQDYRDAHKNHKFTPEQYEKVLNHLNNLRPTLYSDERNKKISDALTGVPHTQERKNNVSLAKKGTVLSQETKNKIALSLKGKKRGPYKKKNPLT